MYEFWANLLFMINGRMNSWLKRIPVVRRAPAYIFRGSESELQTRSDELGEKTRMIILTRCGMVLYETERKCAIKYDSLLLVSEINENICENTSPCHSDGTLTQRVKWAWKTPGKYKGWEYSTIGRSK